GYRKRRTRHISRTNGDDVPAATAASLEIFEKFEAALGVFHHYVLQTLAQKASKSCSECLWRFNPVRDQTKYGLVSLAQEGAGASADAFQTAMKIFQNAKPVALHGKVVL